MRGRSGEHSADSDGDVVRFGDFELDFARQELRSGGAPVELQPTPLRLLLYLAEHRDRTVHQRELLDELWPDVHVTDTALANALSQARHAVGDDGTAQRVIRTSKGRGYRFVAETDPAEHGAAQSPQMTRTSWRAIVAVSTLGVVIAAVWWFGIRERGAIVVEPIRRIAILPLENLSDLPAQQHFADAMAQALISEFGQITSLQVLSRSSGEHCRDANLSLAACARVLNVQGFIEGSVFRSGDSVRIELRLIDARTEQVVLTRTYERGLRDVFSLLRDIAGDVVHRARAQLTSDEEARLRTAHEVDPRAADAYFRAIQIASASPIFQMPSWGPATIEQLERAVELDPYFAEAWAALGLYGAVLSGLSPGLELSHSPHEAAQTALELDENLASAHMALGNVLFHTDWDFDGARATFGRALALSPNDGLAVVSYARFLLEVDGRTREALALLGRLPLLDPLSLSYRREVADLLWEARRYEDGLREVERLREVAPDYDTETEGGLYISLARFAEAHRAYVRFVEACGEACGKGRLEATQRGWAETGWKGQVSGYLRVMENAQPVPPLPVALGHILLGEFDEAFHWLDLACHERAFLMNSLQQVPQVDPLRADPRFNELLRCIGLPSDPEPGVQAGTGRALALMGRPSEAIAQLEQALDRAPEDPRLARWLYYMALAHFAAERHAQAVDYAQRALDHAPGRYTTEDARLVLASGYAHLDRAEQARHSLDEALRTWPDLTSDLVPLPLWTDRDFRDRYVSGLRIAGLER